MASCRHFPESGAATFPEFTADISGIHNGANIGVAFSGTGAVTSDVFGVAGAGGDIELFLDKATFSKLA